MSLEMSFGDAVTRAINNGERIYRKGWNGKGIFVFHVTNAYFDLNPDTRKEIGPFLAIDTTGLESKNEYAPRSIVPWLASQTDIQASYWIVQDENPVSLD